MYVSFACSHVFVCFPCFDVETRILWVWGYSLYLKSTMSKTHWWSWVSWSEETRQLCVRNFLKCVSFWTNVSSLEISGALSLQSCLYASYTPAYCWHKGLQIWLPSSFFSRALIHLDDFSILFRKWEGKDEEDRFNYTLIRSSWQ